MRSMKVVLRRRTLIKGAMGAAALTLVGGADRAMAAAASDEDARVAALLQKLAEDYLQRSPEEATAFDYDTGDRAHLRSQLDDRSLDAIAQHRRTVNEAFAELSCIDPAALSPAAMLDYEVAVFVYATLKDQLSRYGYVDINLRPSPYVVSQMNGAYFWLPEFLGSRHPLQTAADADAYLMRLNALGRVLDQETGRIRHDASLGVILPDFTLATTMFQVKALMETTAGHTAMIAPAVKRARAAGLGDIGARAERIFLTAIRPALSRQLEALHELRRRADSDAGVWALPDGEAYYAAAVRSNTTADMAVAELHDLGLQRVADLSSQLDRSLRMQGYTAGPVSERIKALNGDARFLVSEDDKGRAQLLAAARTGLDKIRKLLPVGFRTIADDPLDVRRTPVAIESGAPGAFYSEGAAGEPATFSLNLKSTAQMPLWRLPTLSHHEGLPGHHFQYSVLKTARDLPLFRRLVRFSAYTEGWALYAERVADELGVYRDDPLGQVGLLQSELFRAARIVVDTGIHHKRWTRGQAIQWMVENAGEQTAGAQREIDRYCVYPGQACSFMVGAMRIREARERARQRLGARFDVRDFHDLVLLSGPVPLDVLESTVDRWDG